MQKKIPLKTTIYKNLDFPLNVYAQCLLLDTGHVDYLHYGLFDQQHTTPTQAQQHSTQLVQQQLPSPPCHILEIGSGLGTSATLLAKQGYQITTLCPDEAQFQIASDKIKQANLLNSVNILPLTFADFYTQHGQQNAGFDLILCQESAQYIDTLALFNHGFKLLKTDGQLLILDEFSLKRTEEDINTILPLLKQVKNQAKRCGFNLTFEQDWSPQATPTTDYLLATITKYQQQLCETLPVTTEMIDDLLASTRLYQHCYQQGRYGYALLKWQKGKTPRWQVTASTPEDQPAVCGLFKQVFKQPMSEALWAWKYAEGRGMATLGWKGQQLVAHYGGLLRDLRCFGQPRQGVQIGDVMVLPQERGVLTRQSAFFQTATTFPERYVGYGQQVYLGYGFPNFHAMKVAERLKLYAEVGRMAEIHWTPIASRARLMSSIRVLSPEDANLAQWVDILWAEMADDLTQDIIGVRDWGYIQHRYCQHPEKNYQFLLVKHRISQKPLGLAIIWREGNECKLMDYIGSRQNLHTVLLQTRRMLHTWQVPTLTTWVSDNFKPLFLDAGGVEYPLDVRVPTSIWTQGISPETIKNHWWLMIGDTDFN